MIFGFLFFGLLFCKVCGKCRLLLHFLLVIAKTLAWQHFFHCCTQSLVLLQIPQVWATSILLSIFLIHIQFAHFWQKVSLHQPEPKPGNTFSLLASILTEPLNSVILGWITATWLPLFLDSYQVCTFWPKSFSALARTKAWQHFFTAGIYPYRTSQLSDFGVDHCNLAPPFS